MMPATAPHIVSIQVGLPATYGSPASNEPWECQWTTAIYKQPVAGPVAATRLGLAGDGVADRENHGDVDKAVLAYAASHYDRWRTELGRNDLCFGGFGENLTIEGLTEHEVCIGDVWSCGPVRFQISQPRQPCWKLARRWRIKELTALVINNGRTGWYLRMLTTGLLTAGDALQLEHRPHAEWTVARAHHVMHHAKHDVELSRDLAALPELASTWQQPLQARASQL